MGGGQQPPKSSQWPGRNHERGETAQRAEEWEANKTNSTQRQGPGHPGPESRESQKQRGRATRKRTEAKAAARKTARHEKGEGGSNYQVAANGQAGATKEARAHGEPRSRRPTKQTAHSAKAQGTWGWKAEKARDNRGVQRERRKKGAQIGSEKDSETQKSGGGAATTKEQPMARQEPRKRRDRTESRGVGGQQNKQHTAPRPRAPGAGKQRKPETTWARNEKKKGGQSSREKQRDTKRGRGAATTK